jgi:D-alanyl-D-alanine carboxypeptidase (penicillin-binding protein 5/6)
MPWLPHKLVLLATFLAVIYFLAWPLTRPNPVDSRLLPLVNFPLSSPPVVNNSNLPIIGASSFILLDDLTNTILIAKEPYATIFPASLTKLATALTALNIYPLDEVVTVKEIYTEGKVMNLQLGEKITVKSLATALLIFSANDAAITLANHHSQGRTGFIAEMNTLAKKYLLINTNFTNVDGIHSPSHFSTVYDLAQLGRVSVRNPFILATVKQTSATVTDLSGAISHPLVATNELLGKHPEIEGLKTGWTPEAGGCFVGLINLSGHKLISVVAQSPDRFADTLALLSWARSNLTWPSSPTP